METVFLAKIPIFDGEEKLYGFDIKFDFNSLNKDVDFSHLIKKLYTLMTDINVVKSLNGKHAFIHLMTDILIFTDFTSLLPKDIFVIKVFENQIRSKSVMDKVKELRLSGYKFCICELSEDTLKAGLKEDYLKLFEFVEVEKTKIEAFEEEKINQLLSQPYKFIVDEVDSYEEFRTLKGKGFNLFKGEFFTKPEVIQSSIENFSKIETLKLIRIVHEEDDLNSIAEYIKGSPYISLNLLKYINSSYFYFSEPITSVNRAVIYLGKRNLTNWLILLSMISLANTDIKRELIKRALFRSKAMELITKRINSDENISDTAFLVGILSLSEAVFSIPMESILKELNLRDSLAKDIKEKTGFFGKILALVELMEKNRLKEGKEIVEDLMLDYSELADVSVNAFKWSEEMSTSLYK